jgi:hypothetical protein
MKKQSLPETRENGGAAEPSTLEDHVSKIPYVFYDIIARIVPGMFIVGIYMAHDEERFKSIGSAIFGIVFAYVLGFCFNVISKGPDWIYLNLKNKIAKKPVSEKEMWTWTREDLSLPEVLKIKMMAERSFFLSLLLASILMCFWSPIILKTHRWAAPLAIPVFVAGFYGKTENISKRVREYQAKENS